MPAVHAFVGGNGFLFNIFPLGFMVLFIVFVAMPGKDQQNLFFCFLSKHTKQQNHIQQAINALDRQ